MSRHLSLSACLGLILASFAWLLPHAPGATPANRVRMSTPPATKSPASAKPPRIRHLFVIVLENEDGARSFGADPPSPYLGTTLRRAGAFIPNYYAVAHQSLPNYIAMVSGQPPNPQTQADCPLFTEMLPGHVDRSHIARGQGCVYPARVRTVADQLEDSGHSWRAFLQDMGNSAGSGVAASCRRPAIGAADPARSAQPSDQYATRHNPFVYFHSLIDSGACRANDIDLGRLRAELRRAQTTPNYVFIGPDLCAGGHDPVCADGVSPGGFAGIDRFLREWVPRIKASPAYADHGAILITFDESASGAGSCCGQRTGPNTPDNGGAIPGSGGGRVGAVVLSPCIQPGTLTRRAYNHYSLLRWTEDNFGLGHLASAGFGGLRSFGPDVFSRPSCGR